MNKIELIGWGSAFCYTLSAVPFAAKAILSKSSSDTPWTGVLLILAGAGGMFIYEGLTTQKLPQLFDFSLSFLCWTTVLYKKIKYRKI